MGLALRNIFYDPKVREKLARNLRNLGFYVHLHSYEYLIMLNEKILATIYLHPRENEVVINLSKYNPKSKASLNDIISVIRSIDKGENKIIVREVPVHGEAL